MFSYNQKQLDEKRKIGVLGVDGEMAGVAIMKEWIIRKYGGKFGALKYGSLFYIADIVPGSPKAAWKSILDKPDKLLPLKKKGLKIAINALRIMNSNNS